MRVPPTADERAVNYHCGRARLIREMGGACVGCGTKIDLEFHHKDRRTRTWVANRTARWVRLARYRREWHQGLIELRCGACNKKAPHFDDDQEIPE